MKIGVLGSGDVAKALAGGFFKHGHQVVLGTRDAAKLADWVVQHRGAQTGSLADAAKFAELVVLAVKGDGGARRAHRRRRGESDGQARDRRDQPDRGCTSCQRRSEVFHLFR